MMNLAFLMILRFLGFYFIEVVFITTPKNRTTESSKIENFYRKSKNPELEKSKNIKVKKTEKSKSEIIEKPKT